MPANNCYCGEMQKGVPGWGPNGINHYKGDVQATIDFGFDGIKLDACGIFLNLSLWAELLNETGKHVLIENCHWGHDGPATNNTMNPTADPRWAPFNFFRVSADITNSWFSVMHNIQSLVPWQPWFGCADPVRTGPGKWAYADMLEVGNLPSFNEDRTHFGLWAITSQPLILGYDVTNATTNKRVWPIITNPHAIAVSQSYEGHPGGIVRAWVAPPAGAPPPSPPGPDSARFLWGAHYVPGDDTMRNWTTPKSGATGELKHGGYCVEVGVDSHGIPQAELGWCSGAANQSIFADVNGSFHLASNKTMGCVSVVVGKQSQVGVGECGSSNTDFLVWPGGYLCSIAKDSGVPGKAPGDYGPGERGYCLASRDQDINNDSGSRGIDDKMQIWAKPQAKGAVAVLVVNGQIDNRTMVVNFDALHVADGAKSFTAFDVWEKQPVKGTFTGSFTTDTIAPHDSRFYVFTPSSSSSLV
jgi:hypothetical protein